TGVICVSRVIKKGPNTMDKKSDAKRNLILTNAKNVFTRKGYATVTMKDIIEECGISRGGIYLYFRSVEQIFMQVIESHNQQKIKETKQYISENKSFEQMIDEYLTRQKKRLMNLNNSLLIAMYEYRFANKCDNNREFFLAQFTYTKSIILSILNSGFAKSNINNKTKTRDMDALASSIVLLIEGISMLAVAVGISEEFIDSQITVIKQMIFAYQPIRSPDEGGMN
ncbi:MAG: TetR/AcrR family transcriptional regulator, partial [Defluviitaleaceae bacterium]|nr:TetR/AcrR family transcriptional regulator [Defluviitaleaceae bacterium]